MAIAGKNLPVLALLGELHIECLTAERAIKMLRHGARHWRLMNRGMDFDRKFPPGEIIAWASVPWGLHAHPPYALSRRPEELGDQATL